MDELLKDARFKHIARDPKFKRIPKSERKVKIDNRFRDMFTDKRFGIKYTVDKRGRPVRQTTTENLKKYYDLDDSEDEDEVANVDFSKVKSKKLQNEEGKEVKVVERKEFSKKGKNDGGHDDDSSDDSSDSGHDDDRGNYVYDDDRNNDDEDDDGTVNKDENISYNGNDKNEDIGNSSADEDEDFPYSGVDICSSEDEDDTTTCSNRQSPKVKPTEVHDEDTEKDDTSDDDEENDTMHEQINMNDEEENKKQLQIRRKNEKQALPDAVKEKLKNLDIDYARGEDVLMTDSSSDEESSESADEGEEIEHNWGQLDKEAETTDEATRRLGLCNMDWDRIRATDLMVLFNSFLPSGGFIHCITIYPSAFGQQRMKEEEITGPQELVAGTSEEKGEDNEEGSSYHMEKLRQYQLNRLKYYYAVIDCDSAETASKLYNECDGMEYESTATKLDLRFIPDDMSFDQEPREVCDQLPELSKYQPRLFTTTALQQVKVDLTWDETNPERKEITDKLATGKLDDVDENDIQAYLASGSSDEDSDDKKQNGEKNDSNSDSEGNVDPVEKYKALLRNIEEQEEAKRAEEVELEFTWGLGEKEKTEKLVKERMEKKKNESLTPFEQYLEKRKAKKKLKKQKKEMLKSADDRESSSEDSIPEGVDIDDEYFKEERQGKMKLKKGHGKYEKKTALNSDDERSKAELELLLMEEDEVDDKRHFNMKQIEEQATMSKSKKKRLSKKKSDQDDTREDAFEVDVKDPRFNALYTSHHYNIDPADPHYRKTKGTEALVTEKLKRRLADNEDVETQPKKPKTEDALNMQMQAIMKRIKNRVGCPVHK